MLFRNRYSHTNHDFYNLKLLKVPEINKYFSLIFVYRSLNYLIYPIDYFTRITNLNTVNLRNQNQLRPPFASSTQSQSSPQYYCCKLWNELPDSIKNKPSIVSFRFALKHYLLETYLN